MNPKDLLIKGYTYQLPEERIAKFPLPERDASKLLIYKEGEIKEDIYRNISTHIPADSLLVFNNSKVVAARILFQKKTGGIIELFCLEPGEGFPDINIAMSQKGQVEWQCLVGGASKWKHGQVLEKEIDTKQNKLHLSATYLEKKQGFFVISFSWQPQHLSFAEVLHLAGAIPLPPYIKRDADASDADRYQTVYAREQGSVAAPTAGLHFTKSIFDKLASKNISSAFLSLHVGAGTFKPVKSETLAGHEMHAEFIDVNRPAINQLLNAAGNIIVVGTTSLRTLESLYWLGCQFKMNTGQPGIDNKQLVVGQWDWYDKPQPSISPAESMRALLDWMDKNNTDRLIAKTQILIAPGYKPKMVKAIITNFHQPQSTLLVLIAALIGENWKRVYEYALENDFRFLSYGDGCFLWIAP